MNRIRGLLLVTLLALAPASQALADELMPSFNTVPTGWYDTRYPADSISNPAPGELAIGIGPNGSFSNRPSGFQSGFYSTQGIGHAISGGANDLLSAQLYVPTSWQTPANGSVRTDMWGSMTDGVGNPTNYPIIGFTNYGTGIADQTITGATGVSYTGFRVWDDNANGGNGGWADLSSVPVKYGQFNTLSIDFTGTDFEYFVNGALVYDEANLLGSVDFSQVFMEAFNFDGDPNSPGANVVPYTALWANAVPEPNTLALFGAALGIGLMWRRRKVTAA